MSRPPTPDEVRDLYMYLPARYDAKVEDKRTSAAMRALRPFIGDVNRHAVAIGRTIYIPFTPGEVPVEGVWDLWAQVRVLVHEMVHVEQYAAGGRLWQLRYLALSSFRALAEAEAYSAGMEMDFWRFGEMPDARNRAEVLRGYRCTDDDISVAAAYLESRQATILDGGSVSSVARAAIARLELTT